MMALWGLGMGSKKVASSVSNGSSPTRQKRGVFSRYHDCSKYNDDPTRSVQRLLLSCSTASYCCYCAVQWCLPVLVLLLLLLLILVVVVVVVALIRWAGGVAKALVVAA